MMNFILFRYLGGKSNNEQSYKSVYVIDIFYLILNKEKNNFLSQKVGPGGGG